MVAHREQDVAEGGALVADMMLAWEVDVRPRTVLARVVRMRKVVAACKVPAACKEPAVVAVVARMFVAAQVVIAAIVALVAIAQPLAGTSTDRVFLLDHRCSERYYQTLHGRG